MTLNWKKFADKLYLMNEKKTENVAVTTIIIFLTEHLCNPFESNVLLHEVGWDNTFNLKGHSHHIVNLCRNEESLTNAGILLMIIFSNF